ncbi:glutamate--tRNA ligase [Aristophania vespae]|uniref:Glutamate--tRNA ligase n=1 Tax=Aristophania vespae TaxID=2697033 RepID=A0A6P1NFK1_9PROT|nr:glutamate--tRNA ligase [Aristophania vespae]QHI95310.1 glutamate--tRNA ligase [Aristophania vespae]UMM64566.1 Glutamate--tRNA ligase 1 [Aristophania vespae]
MKLRFAPSPTGSLHVGNARLAVANYLFARKHKGTFLLRMDDTDTQRGRKEYEEGIRRDLKWLGLEWDENEWQSKRLERYAEVVEELKASGRLYPCFESELELKIKREQRLRAGKPPIYDRAMLKMTQEQKERAEANGKVPYWRFKLTDNIRHWHDLVMGDTSVKLTAVSDPVLIRADGSILYTLASVIDDLDMGVTHIVRGEDHITNTGVQLDIAEALGAKPDHFTFAHLPLLLGSAGEKLSKRIGALALSTLRHDGIEPQAIVAYLARLGTSDDPEVAPMDVLIRDYDLGHVSKSAARFDMSQLLALNRRTLHSLPFDEVRDRLPQGADEAFWLAIRGNIDLISEVSHWWDVFHGSIVPPSLTEEHEFLSKAKDLLPPEPWDETFWKTWIGSLKAETGRKGKTLFMPLRLALTGEDAGPELAHIMQVMGRAKVIQRLEDALNS